VPIGHSLKKKDRRCLVQQPHSFALSPPSPLQQRAAWASFAAVMKMFTIKRTKKTKPFGGVLVVCAF
jgi:hypothetical protein